jgi:hypothetical protein
VTLLPHHRQLIESSAISSEVAEARGYYSVSEPKELNGLFSASQRRAPALVIPVWDVYGDRAFFQLRPDEPRVKNGRTLKYETPAAVRMALDVPPATRSHLHDPGFNLWITEGVRKADALVSADIKAIALLGVWNWRGGNYDGGKTALPDWEMVALNRRVIVCFDSDAWNNPNVYHAVRRFGRWLESRGATVDICYLPHGRTAGRWAWTTTWRSVTAKTTCTSWSRTSCVSRRRCASRHATTSGWLMSNRTRQPSAWLSSNAGFTFPTPGRSSGKSGDSCWID